MCLNTDRVYKRTHVCVFNFVLMQEADVYVFERVFDMRAFCVII